MPNFSSNIKVHNKFKFEVMRDRKIIQEAKAENVILNSLFNRLVNAYDFFSNIVFGSGTGTPTSADAGMFAYVGNKTASQVTIIKALPISQITKVVTLNPEEYVGKTLTEVGIGSGSTAYTHAMITDMEGNNISLTKTSTDVLKIYATLYVELINPNENLRFIDLSSNPLLAYLLQQYNGLGYYATMIVHEGMLLNGTNLTNGITDSSDTISLIKDTANKKISYKYRFPINKGNLNIRGIGVYDKAGGGSKFIEGYIAAVNFPCVGIFENLPINNEILGTGDGINKLFNLKKQSPGPPSIVKIQESITTDYEVSNIIDVGCTLDSFSNLNNAIINDIAISKDAYIVGVAPVSPNPFNIYKYNIDTKKYNILQSFPNIETGTGSGYVEISKNGNYVLATVASKCSVYFANNVGETYTKIQEIPSVLKSIISNDDQFIITFSNTSTINVYKLNNSTNLYELLQSITASTVRKIKISEDKSLLVVCDNLNTKIYKFNIETQQFEVVQILELAYYSTISISKSKKIICIGKDDKILVYSLLNNSYELIQTINQVSNGILFRDVFHINNDNQFMVNLANINVGPVQDRVVSYIKTTTEGQFIFKGQIPYAGDGVHDIRGGTGPTLVTEDLKKSFTYIRTSGGTQSIIFIRRNDSTSQIIFNEPPNSGDTISCDYIVDYIPKSTDYILDINFEFIFS